MTALDVPAWNASAGWYKAGQTGAPECDVAVERLTALAQPPEEAFVKSMPVTSLATLMSALSGAEPCTLELQTSVACPHSITLPPGFSLTGNDKDRCRLRHHRSNRFHGRVPVRHRPVL